jgi:hypothetical protein
VSDQQLTPYDTRKKKFQSNDNDWIALPILGKLSDDGMNSIHHFWRDPYQKTLDSLATGSRYDEGSQSTPSSALSYQVSPLA